MNYYKKRNRKKFISYWRGEAQKKLVRCSKELGFYPNLKKALSPKGCGVVSDEHLEKVLNGILIGLYNNRKDIINFNEVLIGSKLKKCIYPVYTALHSELFLSHLFCFTILQDCKLSYIRMREAFTWVTDDMFCDKTLYCKYKKAIGYMRIFIN